MQLVVVSVTLAVPSLGLPCSLATAQPGRQCSCCPDETACGCCAGPSSPGGQERPAQPAASPVHDEASLARIPSGPMALAPSAQHGVALESAPNAAALSLFLVQRSLRC